MTTKIKVKAKDVGHDILVLVKHPMETGLRTDAKTGEVVPAHYITNMAFSVNGTQVAETMLSQAVSANPLTTINLTDLKAGDVVSVSWEDNTGTSESAETTIK